MGITVQDFHLEPVTAGDDCAVLRIAGEIDVYTAPKLREQVVDLVTNDAVHIIADMRGVEFLDSTGLGALVGSLKRLRGRDGSFTLVINSDRIHRVFRITGLTKIFTFHASVQDAIEDDRHWRRVVERDGRSVEQWCLANGLL